MRGAYWFSSRQIKYDVNSSGVQNGDNFLHTAFEILFLFQQIHIDYQQQTHCKVYIHMLFLLKNMSRQVIIKGGKEMADNVQQNIQTKEGDVCEALRGMNLLDDFLFDVTTVNLEACKIILELSLGIHIRRIRWREGQKVIHNIPGKRGIRLDFYVEDEFGNVFDVEMQNRNEGNLPKRTRFYQALIDAPLLKSGEKNFDSLNQAIIVVICGFDPFGQGLYKYTFENRCEELKELVLKDGCRKIFLNTKGMKPQGVDKSLVDFLHYVGNSVGTALPEECDERIRRLHSIVESVKSNTEIGVMYMKMEERDRLIREEGRKAGIEAGKLLGLISLVRKKCMKGVSVEEAAVELEEEPEKIRTFYALILNNLNETDEKIMEIYLG